ncbi:MAG: DNA gyrase inhibitor YacG [Caldimonas sp.]
MRLSAERLGTPVVRCPTCGGDSQYAGTNPYRPFCSGRCKNEDFDAWAREDYKTEPAETIGDARAAE